jgi:galectin-4
MLHNPYNQHFFQVPQPQVPYHGDIPHGMAPGKLTFVSGQMHGQDFHINFLTHDGSIALHFNPRLHMHRVVRNSQFHGAWGNEEIDGPMPFHHGQHFEVIFKCEHDKFMIAVNGQHSYEYHHRTSFESISHLEINGNIHLSKVTFAGGHAPHHGHHDGMPVPFSVPLQHVHPGKMVQVLGDVPHHSGRFVVNLQCGGGDAQNIAFHFSARFDDPYDGQVVVVANRQHGNWGEEIRQHAGHFPFYKGQHFEILILVEHHEYKVAVNGQHFTSMGHRNPLHDANHLHVEGDVNIRSIREF